MSTNRIEMRRCGRHRKIYGSNCMQNQAFRKGFDQKRRKERGWA
jgi:hypothetical protein